MHDDEKFAALRSMREESVWKNLFKMYPSGAQTVEEANHILTHIVATFQRALKELELPVTVKLALKTLKGNPRQKIESLVVFGGKKTIVTSVKVQAAFTNIEKTAFYLGNKDGVLVLVDAILDKVWRPLLR